MESDWELEEILKIRRQIDEVDDKILKLLNRRAELVKDIWRIKKNKSLPVYMPDREKEIIDRMCKNNKGPLPDGSLIRLYVKILEEFRNLESIF